MYICISDVDFKFLPTMVIRDDTPLFFLSPLSFCKAVRMHGRGMHLQNNELTEFYLYYDNNPTAIIGINASLESRFGSATNSTQEKEKCSNIVALIASGIHGFVFTVLPPTSWNHTTIDDFDTL